MPKITMMPSGINAAFAGGNSAPVKRGGVCGLTKGSARRNKAFLMSIDTSKLHGTPVTMTFTLRDAPESSKEWDKLKRRLWPRLKRLGMFRAHFVTEWTRRGVPHLHVMAFFESMQIRLPDNSMARLVLTNYAILQHWLSISHQYGTGPQGQHVRIETDRIDVAWFKYMSKHASRSAFHYQRQSELIPKGWHSTGRMWGKVGSDWPVHHECHELDNWAFHSLRRQVRRLRRAKARTDIKSGRLKSVEAGLSTLAYLRSQKRITCAARSATLPISEWVDIDVTTRLLEGIHLNIEPKLDRMYPSRQIAWSTPQQGLGRDATALAPRYASVMPSPH